MRPVGTGSRDLDAPVAGLVEVQMGHVRAGSLQALALERGVGIALERGGGAVEDEGADVYGRVAHGRVVVGDSNWDSLLVAHDQLRSRHHGLQRGAGW